MSLTAAVVVDRPGFRLDLALTVAAGETVAVVGPNGAGKSTLLGVLAGVTGADRAEVVLDGEVLDGPGRHLPPEARRVGWVPQDLLLFPHLSALDNVAFGLRARGVDRRRAREEAGGRLASLGLDGLGDRRPHALSGGQAQRVALARALAPDPRLLLLDEPLAALDAATRTAVRRDLAHQLDRFGGPALVVTHDPLDALLLGDRVVVLDGGTVVQDATPDELTRRPRGGYAAQLAGRNLLRGTVVDGGVALPSGARLVAADPGAGDVPARGTAVWVSFRPSAVALFRDEPHGTPRNVWRATVVGLDGPPDRVRVSLAGPVDAVAEVTAAAVAELGLTPGAGVWAALKATETDVYPA